MWFSAPEAGTYVFETESAEEGADTVLWLRTECRYEDLGVEVACNDDAHAGTYLSRVSVPLARLERVWVFVGGAGGWTGAYTLNVRFRGP